MQILERTTRSPSARATLNFEDGLPEEPFGGVLPEELISRNVRSGGLRARRSAIWAAVALATMMVVGVITWRQLGDDPSGDSLQTCDEGSAAVCGSGANVSAGDRQRHYRRPELRNRRNRGTATTVAPTTVTSLDALLSGTQVSPPTLPAATSTSPASGPVVVPPPVNTVAGSTSSAAPTGPAVLSAAPTQTTPTTRATTASTTVKAPAATTVSTQAPATQAPVTQAPTTQPPATQPATGSGRAGCWNQVMFDNFDGNSINASNWTAYDSPGNSGYGLRRPSAISVGNGLLTITAQMVNGTLVSGGMAHKFSQAYGRYEARVRTSRDPSMATSAVVLTFPSSNVHPRDGENDIYDMPPEKVGVDRTSFYTFIHKPFGTVHDQEWVVHPVSALDWHTVALEWTPSQMRLYRDGVLVRTIDETSADLIPDVKHFLAIQLDPWQNSLLEPVWMQVDYAKVESPC